MISWIKKNSFCVSGDGWQLALFLTLKLCPRPLTGFLLFSLSRLLDKKVAGKSKAEQMTERQHELERRLQDVTGQLGSGKKSAKKGLFMSSRCA